MHNRTLHQRALPSSSQRRPHIALFSSAALHIGGVERNILQLVGSLGGDFTFSLVGPQPSKAFLASLDALPHNVVVIHLGSSKKLSAVDLPAVLRTLRRLRPDLIHTQDPRGRFLTYPFARALRIRTAHTFHMSPLFYGNGPLKHRAFVAVEGIYDHLMSDGLLFVSANVRDLYDRHGILGNTYTAVIPNGLDLNMFAPIRAEQTQHRAALRNELHVPPETVVLASVGRLHKQKGFDYLIDALARLMSSNETTKPFHIALIGDGEQREQLETQARAADVMDRISFLGWRSRSDVYRLLAGSDFFVLPSRFECFPYTLLEAVAVGLPVISTDVGGNAEIVLHERNGLVVPQGDVPALSTALNRLIEDTELRKVFAAQALADAERFTVEQMTTSTAKFYRQVLDS